MQTLLVGSVAGVREMTSCGGFNRFSAVRSVFALHAVVGVSDIISCYSRVQSCYTI